MHPFQASCPHLGMPVRSTGGPFQDSSKGESPSRVQYGSFTMPRPQDIPSFLPVFPAVSCTGLVIGAVMAFLMLLSYEWGKATACTCGQGGILSWPYIQVLTHYWRLNVSQRAVAMDLQAWLNSASIPLTIVHPQEAYKIYTAIASAWLFLVECTRVASRAR